MRLQPQFGAQVERLLSGPLRRLVLSQISAIPIGLGFAQRDGLVLECALHPRVAKISLAWRPNTSSLARQLAASLRLLLQGSDRRMGSPVECARRRPPNWARMGPKFVGPTSCPNANRSSAAGALAADDSERPVGAPAGQRLRPAILSARHEYKFNLANNLGFWRQARPEVRARGRTRSVRQRASLLGLAGP